jgi:GLE1-like protein
MKPRKLTPLLIYAFLNVAGHALVTTYNTQMIKVMKCLLDDFIPLFPKQALPSTTKLKLLLEETVMSNGKFPIPDGQKMLP